MADRHDYRDLERATVDVWPELGRMLGIGRNKAYELVNTGEIRVIRAGRRILVPRTAIDKYLSGEGGGPA